MNNFNYGNTPQRTNYFTPNPITTTAATNNIVWVQGIEGAKAWQLAPNSMVILLDSEVENKMYIKVSDNIGMSTLRVFSYVEETPTTSNSSLDLSQYVTKDELSTLIKEILKDEQSISTTSTTTDSQQPKITFIKK